MDKVRPINTKPDEFAAAVEAMRRNIANMIEHGKIVAEIKRGYYDALIAQGFSVQEALELVKAPCSI